jgi:hypothetical protein
MYFLADFSRKEKQKDSPVLRNSLIGAGALAVGIPQAVMQVAPYGVMNTLKALPDDELKRLANKHNVKLHFGTDDELEILAKRLGSAFKNSSYAIPDHNLMVLGKGGMRSKGTFYHELGHLKDKGFWHDPKANPKGFKATVSMLRNEGAANVNAIKMRGIKQVPHAALNTVAYLGTAGARHPLTLAGLTAAGGLGLHYLNKRKQQKQDKKNWFKMK